MMMKMMISASRPTRQQPDSNPCAAALEKQAKERCSWCQRFITCEGYADSAGGGSDEDSTKVTMPPYPNHASSLLPPFHGFLSFMSLIRIFTAPIS
jgi:hypothetical protein